MTGTEEGLSRHHVFEQIRASELARGASQDEAVKTATELVDKVLEAQRTS